MAIAIIAIPILMIKIFIGVAYRGDTIIAFNNIDRRMKGVGVGSMLISATIVVYFAVILI